MLSEHRNDEDVVEEIFSAIACLSANCIDNRANFHRAGAEAAMLKAITKHEKNDSVVEAGLTAIANMIQAGVEITSPSSEDSSQISHVSSRAEGDHLLVGSEPQSAVVIEKIVNALVKADGCKVIAKAVLRHASQYRIAEMGCKALSDIGLYGLAFEMRQYSEAVTGSRLPHRSLKSISIECITNRAQVGTSTKLEERILLPLGQSSAPAALVAVLQNYMNDPAVAQWALLALDRIATCNRNIPILHSAGIDALLVLVLQTHFVYHPTLVNLCYRLITHFAVDDESRAFIGTQSGGEVLLISLAHNMSTTLPAKLGSDAISSLCISPEYDAIALMASKDSYGPSYDELDANQRTAEKNPKSQKFEAFTKPRSRSNSGEHDAGQSSEEAPTMSRTLSALFSWQAAATAAPPSPAHSSTPLKSDKAATIPKVVTTFELMSKKGTTDHSAATGGLLGYASGAFISKGLTDQEEEMHTAKAMARSRKSNSSVLITNGVTTILLTIMDLHGSSYEVQIAAANALNSLALDPVHRNELNHESIFDSVVKAFRHCMCTTTSSRAKKTADMDESLHSLDGSGHGATLGDVGSIAESSLDGAKIAESMTGESAAVAGEAEVEDDEDKPARRVLLVILSICIGTLCLPLAEELEGLKSNQEHFFAAGNQNYLGRLNTCELLVECLRVHARVSSVIMFDH